VNQLEIAKNLAWELHGGQYRKDGVTEYVYHPIAVSLHSSLKDDEKAQVAALLHDVLEETKVTKGMLLENFDLEIVWAVELLTKTRGESYMDYLAKVKSNDLARKVKIADMICNLADDPSERQIRKYAVGLEFLTK
jgi:(p)ppGpp synthase/HD superfamily hydrolase